MVDESGKREGGSAFILLFPFQEFSVCYVYVMCYIDDECMVVREKIALKLKKSADDDDDGKLAGHGDTHIN